MFYVLTCQRTVHIYFFTFGDKNFEVLECHFADFKPLHCSQTTHIQNAHILDKCLQDKTRQKLMIFSGVASDGAHPAAVHGPARHRVRTRVQRHGAAQVGTRSHAEEV